MGASPSKPSTAAIVVVEQPDKKKDKKSTSYAVVPATAANFPRGSCAVTQAFGIAAEPFNRAHPMTPFGDQGSGAPEFNARRQTEGDEALLHEFFDKIFAAASRVASDAGSASAEHQFKQRCCLPSLVLRYEGAEWKVVGYFGVRGYDTDTTPMQYHSPGPGEVAYFVAQNVGFVELLQIVPQLARQLMRETGGMLPSSLQVFVRNDDIRLQEVLDKIEAADRLEVSCDTLVEELTQKQRTSLSRMVALRQATRNRPAASAVDDGGDDSAAARAALREDGDLQVREFNTEDLVKLIERRWAQLDPVDSAAPVHPGVKAAVDALRIPQKYVYRMRKQGHVIDRLASDMSSNRHLHLEANNRTLTLYTTLSAKGVYDLAEHVDKPPRGEQLCLCGKCPADSIICPLRNAITILLRGISDGMIRQQEQVRTESFGKPRPITLHSWLMSGAWRELSARGALLPHLSDAQVEVADVHMSNNSWGMRTLSGWMPQRDREVTCRFEVPWDKMMIAFPLPERARQRTSGEPYGIYVDPVGAHHPPLPPQTVGQEPLPAMQQHHQHLAHGPSTAQQRMHQEPAGPTSMLTAKITVHAGNASVHTRLVDAAASSDIRAVQDLLDLRADPAWVRGDGMSALLAASRFGNLDVLQLLMNSIGPHKGALNIVSTSTGWFPLDSAVKYGHGAIVDFLLANGANPNLDSRKRDTFPLLTAVEAGRSDMIPLLTRRDTDARRASADVSKTSCKTGRFALLVAAELGRVDLIHALLQAGATANQEQASAGMFPLLAAAKKMWTDAAITLLHAGADRNKRCHVDGECAILAAARNGDAPLVAELIQRGADVSVVDRTRMSPLDLARPHPEVHRLLWEVMPPESRDSASEPSSRRTEGAIASVYAPTSETSRGPRPPPAAGASSDDDAAEDAPRTEGTAASEYVPAAGQSSATSSHQTRGATAPLPPSVVGAPRPAGAEGPTLPLATAAQSPALQPAPAGLVGVVGTIGRGSFGTVYDVKEVVDGVVERYAVKHLLIPGDTKYVDKEVHNLVKFKDSPYVVDVVRFSVERVSGLLDTYNYFLYMERMDRSLANSGKHSEAAARLYVRDMLNALMELHARKITHRDIKPGNLLLCPDDRQHVKLTGFGLVKTEEASLTVSGSSTTSAMLRGSPQYMAPEVAEEMKYDAACDIWSAGCTWLTLLTGRLPWHGRIRDGLGAIQIMMTVVSKPTLEPDWPTDDVSADALQLLKSMMARKAADRPTATSLLEHRYFKDGRRIPQPPTPAGVSS